jgi:hypothetical protein
MANLFKSRRRLEAENLFLRHQLNIALRRAVPTTNPKLLTVRGESADIRRDGRSSQADLVDGGRSVPVARDVAGRNRRPAASTRRTTSSVRSSLSLRQGRQGVKKDLHLPAQQIVKRGTSPAIGDMNQIHAGHCLEQ